MILFSRILGTIFAMGFSSPIFPYLIFRRLIRKDIIMEAAEYNSKDKLGDVIVFIWICMAYVVTPILISIVAFLIIEKWYLMLIAYVIFWQLIYACSLLKKRMVPIIVPILAMIFIICIALLIKDFIV